MQAFNVSCSSVFVFSIRLQGCITPVYTPGWSFSSLPFLSHPLSLNTVRSPCQDSVLFLWMLNVYWMYTNVDTLNLRLNPGSLNWSCPCMLTIGYQKGIGLINKIFDFIYHLTLNPSVLQMTIFKLIFFKSLWLATNFP